MRSTDDGDTFQQIDAVEGTTTYHDTTLEAGQTVSYKIVSTLGETTAPASSPASASALPAAPTDLEVAPLSTTSLSLTWVDQFHRRDRVQNLSQR